MGKHTNPAAVDRAGLLRRYAALRGVTPAVAERLTRYWSRTELRHVVEGIEAEERPYAGRHARFAKGRTTTVTGSLTVVEGLTR